MPWWAWLVLGIGLLGVELLIIDAQFYLVFIGLSAAVVGLLGLFGIGLPEWAEWLVFAVLSIIAMLAFRRRIYELLRGGAGQVEERLTVGDRVRVSTRLEPGESGRVEYRGSSPARAAASSTAVRAGPRATRAPRPSRRAARP